MFGSYKHQTFIPISKFSGSHHGSAHVTPTPWGSNTPISGRSSIEITSPGMPKYSTCATPTFQNSPGFATPVSPNKLKMRMEHARNQSQEVNRSDSIDSGVECIHNTRSPTPAHHGVTVALSPSHNLPSQLVLSPPNIMSPPAARQQVTQNYHQSSNTYFEFPPPENKLRNALLAQGSQEAWQVAHETQQSPVVEKTQSHSRFTHDKVSRTNLTKEFEKVEGGVLIEGHKVSETAYTKTPHIHRSVIPSSFSETSGNQQGVMGFAGQSSSPNEQVSQSHVPAEQLQTQAAQQTLATGAVTGSTGSEDSNGDDSGGGGAGGGGGKPPGQNGKAVYNIDNTIIPTCTIAINTYLLSLQSVFCTLLMQKKKRPIWSGQTPKFKGFLLFR